MDSTRFDDLLRSIASGLSRRATLAALASSFFAAGSVSILNEDAEAKKKRKKKKKKCKSGTKKCGKKCIAAIACCSSAECGNGGVCVSGACDCLSGFIPCEGACLPDDQCCPACTGNRVCESGECVCDDGFQECGGNCIPETDCCEACSGDLICEGGECVCPEDAPIECPGAACNVGDSCCDDVDCPVGQDCDDGFCLCTGAGEFTCFEDCCDPGSEICSVPAEACEAGGCPATDFCIDIEFYFCDEGCVCTTTVNAPEENACVDAASIEADTCSPCSQNSDCGLDEVCVSGGDFCSCENSYCVSVCGAGAPRAAGARAGVVSTGGLAARGKIRKRRQRRSRR